MRTRFNPQLHKMAMEAISGLNKQAFVPAQTMGQQQDPGMAVGGAAPPAGQDPSGTPPAPPGGSPGAIPAGPAGMSAPPQGAPVDPAAMGAPPAAPAPGGDPNAPASPEELMAALSQIGGAPGGGQDPNGIPTGAPANVNTEQIRNVIKEELVAAGVSKPKKMKPEEQMQQINASLMQLLNHFGITPPPAQTEDKSEGKSNAKPQAGGMSNGTSGAASGVALGGLPQTQLNGQQKQSNANRIKESIKRLRESK